MDIKSKYETFGRDIEIKEITGIHRIEQPGILSKYCFFNPGELNHALDDIAGYSNNEILVYFRNIAGGVGYSNIDKKRKWWDMIQKFNSFLGKDFPAGIEMKYWYGPDGKEFSSPDFKENNPPYQAFIELFNNAIQGFSCFVKEYGEGIDFSSHRTNYETMKPGESLIDDQKTLWTGNKDAFLKSAFFLHKALYEIGRTERVELKGFNFEPAEVRIISTKGEALVGSLIDESSVTLFIDNSSLERIVNEHNERKRHN